MKKIVKGFYFWLLVAVVVPFAIVSAVNIGGLGWAIYNDEPDFTIDVLLILLFFVQIIIANRVFGIKGGIISSFGLGALIILQVMNNSGNEDYFIVIAGIIGIGICSSLLLDRQEKERRLISQQAEERRCQTIELNQEILERKRTEEENEILLESYKQQNSLIIKSNIELEEALTNVKRTDEELKSSEQRFRKLFNESNDAIFIHDYSGTILELNRSSYEMLGYSKETLLKISILDLHPTEELSLAAKALHSIAEKGTYRFESKFKRTDGTIINVDISSKIVDKEKKIVQSIARDITELKKTQEQLRHSQVLASLGEMTAGIAHEVNNPLGIILLYSELLLKSDMSRQAKKDIKVIHDETARAARIMTDLLTYSNGVSSHKRRINIHKVLKKLIEMRRYQESVLDIITTTNMMDRPLHVMGSSSQLTQVFMNFMLNAEEALKECNGGNIVITTQIDREWAKVSIADNGTGIPEENLSQVFHPFFTTKKVGEGTGLGLSTCYGIITAHGGLIRAENNEMGGATFIVELPLAKARRQGSLSQETEKARMVIA